MPLPEHRRPPCPECASPIYRLQRSCGVVAAYPCTCWLTVESAQQVVRTWRER